MHREDSNSKLESEVIGIWHMPQSVNRVMSGMDQSDIGGQSLNASNYSTIITTNTDQKMIDRMSAGVGSISITGMINEELKFWMESLILRADLPMSMSLIMIGLVSLRMNQLFLI